MSLKLMAAVPSHGGTIVMEGALTLLGAQEIVHRRGGTFWFSHFGGATVSLVRNAITAAFLRSEADVLFMLDADQAIEPDLLERMLDLGKPVVGCLYPKRRYDWSKVRSLGSDGDRSVVPAQALEFVGHLEEDEEGKVSVVDGFARAEHVGTGALIVRRDAFERMMARYPELEGRGFGSDTFPGLDPNWGFFNPIDTDQGLPLSEDISFCRRWRQAGGEIWADVASIVTHVGLHAFAGSYLGSWQSLQQSRGDAG
jgi:hypothetical protein